MSFTVKLNVSKERTALEPCPGKYERHIDCSCTWQNLPHLIIHKAYKTFGILPPLWGWHTVV